MRSLACFALLSVALGAATPAQADGASLARIDPIDRVAVEFTGGLGAAVLPRVQAPAPRVSFGFSRPAPSLTSRIVVPTAAAPRLTSTSFGGAAARVLVTPTPAPRLDVQGFGGHAVRVLPRDLEAPLVEVADVVDVEDDLVHVEDVVEVEEIVQPRTVRRVYRYRPKYVSHQSSYYVPTYSYYSSNCNRGWGTCYRSCYRPCYRTCYTPCYSTCYRPYYGCGYYGGYGCGGGFGYGFGWGLGVGLGVGLVAGW